MLNPLGAEARHRRAEYRKYQALRGALLFGPLRQAFAASGYETTLDKRGVITVLKDGEPVFQITGRSVLPYADNTGESIELARRAAALITLMQFGTAKPVELRSSADRQVYREFGFTVINTSRMAYLGRFLMGRPQPT
jgi:hypothetical protein